MRGAEFLELAQMGRNRQGGSCWVLPISVQAQKGTGCSVIGNVSPSSLIQIVLATFSKRANTAISLLLNTKHVLS